MFGKVARDAAARNDAVLSPLALRGRQGLRPLDHGELPRDLRPLRRERHPLQPRVAPAWHGVRHPKVTDGVARIKLGLAKGAPASATSTPRRDWGFAGDYVEAMWLMLQQPTPEITSSPSGETHSVRELTETRSPRGSRLAEARGDAIPLLPPGGGGLCSSAIRPRHDGVLGWKAKVSFEQLVAMMVDADLARLSAAPAPVRLLVTGADGFVGRHLVRRLPRATAIGRGCVPAGCGAGGLGRGGRHGAAVGAHR